MLMLVISISRRSNSRNLSAFKPFTLGLSLDYANMTMYMNIATHLSSTQFIFDGMLIFFSCFIVDRHRFKILEIILISETGSKNALYQILHKVFYCTGCLNALPIVITRAKTLAIF